ncbi:hypothetical protein ACJJTC_000088 [Scirpophaga incertulas]
MHHPVTADNVMQTLNKVRDVESRIVIEETSNTDSLLVYLHRRRASAAARATAMEDEVTFLFQLGVLRDAVSAPAHLLTLAYLKDLAVKFVHDKIPDNGLNRLSERILLFRHDYYSPNVLQLINAATDVTDETLVEIVLTANPLLCDGSLEPAGAAAALAGRALLQDAHLLRLLRRDAVRAWCGRGSNVKVAASTTTSDAR